jgi:hypothetical protein
LGLLSNENLELLSPQFPTGYITRVSKSAIFNNGQLSKTRQKFPKSQKKKPYKQLKKKFNPIRLVQLKTSLISTAID